MKKMALGFIMGALVFGSIAFVDADVEGPRGKDIVLVGEVVEVVNYAMHGRRGVEHLEAMKYRAEHGFPVGILDEESGEVYIAVYRLPVPAAGLQTANAKLLPFLGQAVVVQGRAYSAPGINVIRIAVVSEY